jgi:putative Ca2+/H+ antiporter (TMEM165/GDT1 family)
MIYLARFIVSAAALVVLATTTLPVKAETSFLEAALFFITGVDTTNEDTVTNHEVRLSRYPIVAYLVGQ